MTTPGAEERPSLLRCGVGAAARTLALATSLLACAGPVVESGGPGVVRGAALFAEPWQWQDDHGEAVTLSKWRGAPQVLSMFYATCNLRCPLTVAKLKRVESAFARRSLPVHFLLVTLDPRSDTPEKMRAFRQTEGLSDAKWDLLAGDDRETKALSHILGVRPSYGDTHIDHDVKVGVIDANGVLVRTLDGWHFDDDAVLAAAAGPRDPSEGGSH
jgi:protein SCO1/2